MKNIIISFLFGCMAILISGCSADMPENLDSKSEKASSILQLHLNKADVTRGMNTSTTFQEGDEVLVGIITSIDGPLTISKSYKATYKEGKWIFDSEIDLSKPYMQGDKEREWPDNFYVYVAYPYDKVQLSNLPGSIYMADDLLSQNDIMDGWKYVSKKNPIVEISCEHAMTCLTFKVKNNSNNPVTINGMSVKQKEIKLDIGLQQTFLTSQALFEIESFIPESEQYKNWVDSCYCNYNIKIEPGETGNVDFLLYPTVRLYKYIETWKSEEWEKLQFELSVNGNPVHFDLDPAPWDAGNQYIFPVNLPSDLPEREPKKVHMYDTYDGKHVYWSDINVGAYAEWDYGRLFGWADPSGNKTSENVNDYPSANPPDEIAGTEYDIAMVNWGGNWRMPTNSDIWDLRRCGNYEVEWTSVNGVYGVRVTSDQTGNSIFIPNAPKRIGTSIITNTTYHTQYWLSTLNKDDTDKAQTLFFDYNTSYETPLSFWASVGTERYTGLPVRAIWVDD